MSALLHSFRDSTQRLAFALIALALLLFAFDSAHAHGYKAGALEIGHPWARMTPPGAKVGGAYLSIENTGSTPDRLVSVTVAPDIAGRAEIHEMSVTDGVMKMQMLPDGVAIPAGGKVALAPGGYHLMLQDLKQPLKEGASFKGTLTFEKAGTIAVDFKVEGMAGPKGAAPQAGDPHAGHDMSTMPAGAAPSN
ncbi:copper chaperone PCu(A)C [Ancylobacter sp. Lp-2]|uniref:copper chaperone PCu(A)C n=1 Tax=Ancylobacter sp. Lp-2 TaxID=2881339 RepID=UPI001E2EA657|nr:copper chaperone PCu(A)C [Ancylobacter sp. Lp-2]MCB4769487.1 copper chaperone PCu(A)C [Ancylobacter sp. Lp-2]